MPQDCQLHCEYNVAILLLWSVTRPHALMVWQHVDIMTHNSMLFTYIYYYTRINYACSILCQHLLANWVSSSQWSHRQCISSYIYQPTLHQRLTTVFFNVHCAHYDTCFYFSMLEQRRRVWHCIRDSPRYSLMSIEPIMTPASTSLS